MSDRYSLMRILNILLISNLDAETKAKIASELAYYRGLDDAERESRNRDTTRHILSAP